MYGPRCSQHADCAQQLHTKIPHSELVEIKGADHIVNMSKPDGFNRTVLDFLKKRTRTSIDVAYSAICINAHSYIGPDEGKIAGIFLPAFPINWGV